MVRSAGTVSNELAAANGFANGVETNDLGGNDAKLKPLSARQVSHGVEDVDRWAGWGLVEIGRRVLGGIDEGRENLLDSGSVAIIMLD